MTTRSITAVRSAALVAICAVAGSVPTLGQPYTITDIGSFSGWTTPRALSDTRAIAGVSVGTDWHSFGFVWSGSLAAFGPLPPETECQGMDLNAVDDVLVVAYSLGSVNARAVRFFSGSAFELGAFVPSAINAPGTAVGTREVPGAFGVNQSQAVAWTDGAITVLPYLGGGDFAAAFDIDDSGKIVGSAFPANAITPRAVLWAGGDVFDLGTLGGPSAQALGISNTNYVCGVSSTATAAMRAFRSRLVGTGVVERLDLGTLGGGWSTAYDVNDAGWVVGTSDDRAFVWVDGQMWDLNNAIDPSLGWHLIGATSINNRLEIVGWGQHGADGLRAFLFSFAPTVCPGDINSDGSTNAADFVILAGSFGASVPPNTSGDLNGDGVVNAADFVILAGDFGCGP